MRAAFTWLSAWEATVNYTEWNQRWYLFLATLIWCLPDNERSDCALVSKDVDLMFTWQRAKRLCARFQWRWFYVYLTTSEVTVRSFPRTLIWCLIDNKRSDCAPVSKDADLMFTWQRAKRHCSRCLRMWCSLHGVYDSSMFNRTKTNLSKKEETFDKCHQTFVCNKLCVLFVGLSNDVTT